MKCATVGCSRAAMRRITWRDPWGATGRHEDAVCDLCADDYKRRPALQVRDEGPVK